MRPGRPWQSLRPCFAQGLSFAQGLTADKPDDENADYGGNQSACPQDPFRQFQHLPDRLLHGSRGERVKRSLESQDEAQCDPEIAHWASGPRATGASPEAAGAGARGVPLGSRK